MSAKPFIIGLTGSIGMGKSTTAKLFRDLGVPTWNADDAVAELYAKGGAAVEPIQSVFPSAIVNEAVSKEELKKLISADPSALQKIEEIVHPIVERVRQDFIETATSDIILIDIPLLFEIGAEEKFDAIVVVSVDEKTQRERVLSRPNMTEDHFQRILSSQIPDAQKRARADYVIETTDLESARAQVSDVLTEIKAKLKDA